MWLKTLKVKFQKYNVDVLVYLSDTNENGKEVVKLQSMVNEYYLVEKVEFSTRDAAYDFIKHYPVSMARAFVERTAYESCAV